MYFNIGGTADVTVHEVQEDGLLKELHAATGGAWGGRLVNEAFNEFIRNLVSLFFLNIDECKMSV